MKIKKLNKKIGPFKKSDFSKLSNFYDIPTSTTLCKRFGSIENMIDKCNIKIIRPKIGKVWKKEEIKDSIKILIEKIGQINKGKLQYLSKFYNIPDRSTICRHFGTLDNLAEECNFEFKINKRNFYGNNEKEILNKIEKTQNVKLERQFPVWNGKSYYRIDGFDKIHNVAYEIDEKYHNNRKIEDQIREQNIIDNIGCKFVRINEQQFLQQLNGQKNLGDFNG